MDQEWIWNRMNEGNEDKFAYFGENVKKMTPKLFKNTHNIKELILKEQGISSKNILVMIIRPFGYFFVGLVQSTFNR